MPSNQIYIVQRGLKYLTSHGGWSPLLANAQPSFTREQAARHQALYRAHGTINLVSPTTCARCQTLIDPIMGCAACDPKPAHR